MIYGYARVSSKGQALYGNGLDVQEEKLKDAGAEVVFKDVYTGMKASRPELDKLLSVLRSGDTLVVAKMDRLGRSAVDIIQLIKELVAQGVTINILNMGIADNSPMGRFMVNVLSCVAEFEHDMILTRMQEGKALKRAHDPDYKEGRKAVEYDKQRFEKLKKKVAQGAVSVTEACRDLGISRAKWYRIAQ